jgi:serine/threonine protein kinase
LDGEGNIKIGDFGLATSGRESKGNKGGARSSLQSTTSSAAATDTNTAESAAMMLMMRGNKRLSDGTLSNSNDNDNDNDNESNYMESGAVSRSISMDAFPDYNSPTATAMIAATGGTTTGTTGTAGTVTGGGALISRTSTPDYGGLLVKIGSKDRDSHNHPQHHSNSRGDSDRDISFGDLSRSQSGFSLSGLFSEGMSMSMTTGVGTAMYRAPEQEYGNTPI